MTLAQFKKKIAVAKRSGEASLPDNVLLIYRGESFGWSLIDSKNNQTIDTSNSPMSFKYILD